MANTSKTQKIKVYLMLCYIVLYIIDSFFHLEIFLALMASMIVIICIFAFPSVRGLNKYLSCILFIIGTYLLIKSNASFSIWTEALLKNAGLTVLLTSVPLLSTVFYFEDFDSHILSFAQKHVKSDFSFYIFATIIINFFGIVLNIASVPLVNKLLESVSRRHPRNIFYMSLTRGYCPCMFWSPNFLSVAVTLQYTGLQWYKYAPLGFILSIVGILLSIAMGKLAIKEDNMQPSTEVAAGTDTINGSPNGYGSLVKIACIAVFLILSIVSLQYFTGKGILAIVSCVSVIFPIILGILYKKMNIFKAKFNEYFNDTLPKMNNEAVLFTAVGFFGHALGVSGAAKYIPEFISSIGISNPLILIPFIVLLIVMVSFIGLHPVITISTISIAFFAGSLPLSQFQMAATFALSYFIYTLVSPFSGLILAVISIDHANPFDIGIKINTIYSALLLCLVTIIVTFLW